ncbi:MAG: hypothetical protein V5A56_01060 [Halolamina sp.]
MRRRAILATISAGMSLSGCLSGPGDPAPPSTTTTGNGDTRTPMRKTADGITATFSVVDGHAPTDDTASATFEDERVTVTGTMDPSGCNRPVLTAVRYNSTDGVIHLDIGGKSPYGETATVECGNASYDYRCVLSVSQGEPEAVEVIHNYDGRDNRSFNLVRE